jgi:hydrogenase maturation factor
MIFDMNSSKELIEKLQTAQAIEGAAITALHDAMKGGMKDNATLMALTDRMTEAHNKKMDIWDQLQKHRLDV